MMDVRGVTIYRYTSIAIQREFISYRNTKCVSHYIASFLFSELNVHFSFNSYLIAIASAEGVNL